MKKFKRFICILLLVVIVLGVGAGVTVYFLHKTQVDSSKYTEAQHLKRISDRVRKQFVNDKYGFTDFKAYPLYNENEEMGYCLIEFEPSGFGCIKINKTSSVLPLWQQGMYGADRRFKSKLDYFDGSMHYVGNYLNDPWQRNRVVDSLEGLAMYPEGNWKVKSEDKGHYHIAEVDQDGEFIDYNTSPFKVANVLDQRMYCIEQQSSYYYYFALKQDDGYFNLVSMAMLTEKDQSYATSYNFKTSINI